MAKKIILAVLILGIAAFFFNRKSADPVREKAIPHIHEGSQAEAPPPNIVGDTETVKISTSLNLSEMKQLAILNEILKTKNDNDPRMDRELLVLSPELKLAMEKQYRETAKEKRNELGTIVFLIGRNITEPKDVEFLKSVLLEKPCLSLSDCNRAASPPTGEEEHLEGINATTANYPQLNSLRAQIQKYEALQKDTNVNQDLQNALLASIQEASRSPNPVIAELADQALKQIKN